MPKRTHCPTCDERTESTFHDKHHVECNTCGTVFDWHARHLEKRRKLYNRRAQEDARWIPRVLLSKTLKDRALNGVRS